MLSDLVTMRKQSLRIANVIAVFFVVVVDRRVLAISHMKMEHNSEEIKLTV